MGSVTLNTRLKIYQVICVPSFAYNLFSVSKLLAKSKMNVNFTTDACYIQAPAWTQKLEIGKLHAGLYLCNNSSDPSSGLTPSNCNAMTHKVDINVWHARIGHIYGNLLKLLPLPSISNLQVCDSFHFAKQQRLPFSKSTSISTSIFDLVHADVWGPYHIKTHGHCSYFLTLFEDKSRYTWTMLLADKA